MGGWPSITIKCSTTRRTCPWAWRSARGLGSGGPNGRVRPQAQERETGLKEGPRPVQVRGAVQDLEAEPAVGKGETGCAGPLVAGDSEILVAPNKAPHPHSADRPYWVKPSPLGWLVTFTLLPLETLCGWRQQAATGSDFVALLL